MATVFSLMGQSTPRSNQAGSGQPPAPAVPEAPQGLGFGEIFASGQVSLFAESSGGELPAARSLSAESTGGESPVHAAVKAIGEAEIADLIAVEDGKGLPPGGETLPDAISLQLPLSQNEASESQVTAGTETERADSDIEGQLAARKLGDVIPDSEGGADNPEQLDTALLSITDRPIKNEDHKALGLQATQVPTSSELSKPNQVTQSTDKTAQISVTMPSPGRAETAVSLTMDQSAGNGKVEADPTADSRAWHSPAPTSSPQVGAVSARHSDSQAVAGSVAGQVPVSATSAKTVEVSVPRDHQVSPDSRPADSRYAVSRSADSRSADLRSVDSRPADSRAAASQPIAAEQNPPSKQGPDKGNPDVANIAARSGWQQSYTHNLYKRGDTDKSAAAVRTADTQKGAVVSGVQGSQAQAVASREPDAPRAVSDPASQGSYGVKFISAASGNTVDSGQRSVSFANELERVSSNGNSEADSGIKSSLLTPSQNSGQGNKVLPQIAVSQPVGQSPGWEQAMAGRIVWMGAQGVQSANLTLNPQDLGAIQIQVDIAGDQANVQFQAQSAETCDLIEKLMPRLSHALEGQGLKLEDSRVSQFTPSQDFSNAQQQAANQSAGRHSGEGAQQQAGKSAGTGATLTGQESPDELAQTVVMQSSTGVDYYA